MNKQECEFLIGCLLEDIRRVVKMYDESINHVSLYVTDTSLSAFALTDTDEESESEYQLNFYQGGGEENDDC